MPRRKSAALGRMDSLAAEGIWPGVYIAPTDTCWHGIIVLCLATPAQAFKGREGSSEPRGNP